MKKRLFACTLAILFAGSVAAQTSATITKISSGIGSVSRLGFSGTEDLGSGLSATYVLELGTKIDTGEIDTVGTIFNRQAFVGLNSAALGALKLGRQYTPYYVTLDSVADPFGTAYGDNIKNPFPTAGNNTRASNTMLYTSPNLHGASGELAWSLGEQPGDQAAGRQFGAVLAYSGGPLNVRFGYNNRNNDLSAAAGAAQTPPVAAASRDIGTNAVLAANYDFGIAKLFGAYGRDKGPNSAPLPNSGNPYGGVKPVVSTDGADFLIGASVPAGCGTLIASYVSKDGRTALHQDATQWGIAYAYPLSKRANLYAAHAKIHNKNGAGFTVGNNDEAGSGNAASNLGLRHSF